MLNNVRITYLAEHTNVSVKKFQSKIPIFTFTPPSGHVHTPLMSYSHSGIEDFYNDSNVLISIVEVKKR